MLNSGNNEHVIFSYYTDIEEHDQEEKFFKGDGAIDECQIYNGEVNCEEFSELEENTVSIMIKKH